MVREEKEDRRREGGRPEPSAGEVGRWQGKGFRGGEREANLDDDEDKSALETIHLLIIFASHHETQTQVARSLDILYRSTFLYNGQPAWRLLRENCGFEAQPFDV